jgi:hypothetical protein
MLVLTISRRKPSQDGSFLIPIRARWVMDIFYSTCYYPENMINNIKIGVFAD